MAKLLIFRFSYIKRFFPTLAVYGRTLHIHGPLVLRTCHWVCSICSGRRQSQKHSIRPNTVQLTQSGSNTDSRRSPAWQMNRTPLTGWKGEEGVTFCHCLSIHSFIHIGRKYTCPHQKNNAPHILPLLNTHTLSQNSPCILPLLSFGWVKSSKTPALCLTCLPPQLQESERGKEELVSTGQHFSDKSNYGFMT